jgi:WD40 repeat protein
MADVFLSYSKEHRRLTESLADDLKAQGITVWWDTSLLPAGNFREEIDRELDAAKAVIIIWTPEASRSKWVRAEAEHADKQEKLVNTHAAGLKPDNIPKPFNQTNSAPTEDRSSIFDAVRKLIVRPRSSLTWTVGSGTLARKIEMQSEFGSLETAVVTFSSDGEQIIGYFAGGTSSVRSSDVGVWDFATGRRRSRQGNGFPIIFDFPHWLLDAKAAFAVSPTGKCIVLGTSGSDIIFDAMNGEFRGSFATGNEFSCSPAPRSFSPDGARLARGHHNQVQIIDVTELKMDRRASELKKWKPAVVLTLDCPDTVRQIAYSPDGIWIATSHDGRLIVWDATSGQREREIEVPELSCFAFSPDRKHVATGSTRIKLWSLETGQVRFTVVGKKTFVGDESLVSKLVRSGSYPQISSLAFSLDGTRIVAAYANTIQIMDGRNLKVLSSFEGNPMRWPGLAYVSSIAFSPDGVHFVSGGFACSARMAPADVKKTEIKVWKP